MAGEGVRSEARHLFIHGLFKNAENLGRDWLQGCFGTLALGHLRISVRTVAMPVLDLRTADSNSISRSVGIPSRSNSDVGAERGAYA